MNFEGAGITPYEPPAEELKSFFRKKGRTFYRYGNRSQKVEDTKSSIIGGPTILVNGTFTNYRRFPVLHF